MASYDNSILIADDDQYIRDDLSQLLADPSRRMFCAGTASETWQVVEKERPQLILLDIKFPDSDDLSLLKRIKESYPQTEVIILTSQTEDLSQVVSAIKIGAFDYVGKPFIRDELRNRIEKALQLRRLTRSNQYLLEELERREGVELLIGESAAMQQVRQTIRRLADTDGCVLIHGESGTGKELAAKALHHCSKRKGNPFITLNCASVSETLMESLFFGHRRGAFTGAVESVKGKFDLAEDGTLFLDEIGDMPVSQQPALLRVLEYRQFTPVGESREHECRARFLFATNRDLRDCVAQRMFREDLFYRINVATIALPSLRSRPQDIPILIDHYRAQLSNDLGRRQIGIQPKVYEILQKYDWPGNVRELKNVLEGALMLLDPQQDELSVQDLPSEILALESSGTDHVSSVDRRKKQQLIQALRQCNGSLTEAGKVLGIHRNTVRQRLRIYGITLEEGKPE